MMVPEHEHYLYLNANNFQFTMGGLTGLWVNRVIAYKTFILFIA